MKKLSLRQRILNYYRNHAGKVISGGEIERLVASHTTYKPSNVSRRLRELAEDGLLVRSEVKGTVFYSYQPQIKRVQKVDIIDGVAVISYEEELV